MKIIHCADLHLDSSMNSILTKDKATARRDELLASFVNMVGYAVKEGVSAIIIAGDMFDSGHIRTTTFSTVLDTILGNPQINFYYLRGNHDYDAFLSHLEEIPDNLKFFSDDWTTYNDGVTITGTEITEAGLSDRYDSLKLSSDAVNIVVLHGQIMENGGEINLRKLQNKNIDYLCLGHIHGYKKDRLDYRGEYCYSGCLEPRGFDESGDCGFVLLTVDTERKSIQSEFVPFAKRKCRIFDVDVSRVSDNAEIVGCIRKALKDMGVLPQDFWKANLVGNVPISCDISTAFIEENFKYDYFCVKVYDKTTLTVDYDKYAKDRSLKGEFVRTVYEAEGYTDEEKAEIIRIGIRALMKEDII